MAKPEPVLLHATAVALGGRAVLILGASGSGKSALALALLAGGAQLVSDDRTQAYSEDGVPMAGAPPGIAGLIEARGVGLLSADAAGPTPIALVVDLDRTETARLPAERRYALLGCDLPLLHKVESPHFPAAVLQYLKAGPGRR